MLSIASDGRIHLSLAELRGVTLTHLISGIDEEDVPHLNISPSNISNDSKDITGFTELISQSEPIITIGWDWQLIRQGTHVSLKRICPPRSNIALSNSVALDFSQEKEAIFQHVYVCKLALLESYIDTLKWQTDTLKFLKQLYPQNKHFYSTCNM